MKASCPEGLPILEGMLLWDLNELEQEHFKTLEVGKGLLTGTD